MARRCRTFAVGPPLQEGSFALQSFRKGGCPMSTMEILTFSLVIIGICNLFIQAKKK